MYALPRLYSHTGNYCNNIPRYVCCGNQYTSDTCTKSKDLTANCALCFSEHSANYRSCPFLKNIQNHRNHHSSKAKKNHLNNNIRYQENNNNIPFHSSDKFTSENQITSIPNLSYANQIKIITQIRQKTNPHLNTSDTTTQLLNLHHIL
ncbi:Uncharacterized protein FWK35_00026329 [Aphis craccivora]|uniref:Uncharacterized protein n=1 Tax=Aphis craccivora TaxID=307492 RepID=A0A6G0YDY8_APHCR|nr:Uncharacterized protein FWK35_00026329 [Aphis craccivora]